MESVATVHSESKNHLLERSKAQDARQLFSGSDYRAEVLIYANHIERGTAARLDSYRKAYGEVSQLPTDDEFQEILRDFTETWEVHIKQARQALGNFLASRNAPPALDLSSDLRSSSAHGHDRVLREWKIWRDRVRLEKSTVAASSAAESDVLENVAPKLPEPAKEKSFQKFSRLLAHGHVALVLTLVLGALAVLGVTSTNIAHLLFVLAWLSGSAFIFSEVLPEKSRGYKLLACGLLGVAFLTADLLLVSFKHRQDLVSTTHDLPVINQVSSPTKKAEQPTQPSAEMHGTTDTATAKVRRHGATDTVTATVSHKQQSLKLTFQDSPVLTQLRIGKISKLLNNYYDYLTSEVGLELALELPPVGVSPKGGPILIGGIPGAPPYYSHIIISEDSVDSEGAILVAYSMYAFQNLILASASGASPPEFKGEAIWVLPVTSHRVSAGRKCAQTIFLLATGLRQPGIFAKNTGKTIRIRSSDLH